jgi:hypothetical protein
MESNLKFIEAIGKQIGHWKIESYLGDIVRDLAGNVTNELVETVEGYNLITTVGKGVIMDRIFGLSSVAAVSRIGAGTGNSAAALGNTSLTNGVFVAFDSPSVKSGLTVVSTATFDTNTANITWAELGMDNGGSLFNRIAPIGPITKTPALSLIVTVGITQL